MVYTLADQEVLSAIDCVVRDTDMKYDECLVDRFHQFIQKELNASAENRGQDWFELSKGVLDRIKSYLDHKSFVMLNQTRAFKLLHCVLRSTCTYYRSDQDFKCVLPYLDSLWNTLDIVVLNENESAMTAMFLIFKLLVNLKPQLFIHKPPCYRWLMSKRIEPPLKPKRRPTLEINSVVDLMRFYLETSNNYHTKNKAEELFQLLIPNTFQYDEDQPIEIELKHALKDYIIKGSSSMCYILAKILSADNHCNVKISDELSDKLDEAFEALIENPRFNAFGIIPVVARTSLLVSRPSKPENYYIDKLISKKRLDALIVFLCHQEEIHEQFFSAYVLYPLLSTCSGDETESLVLKLFATRDERDFIDRNMSDRLIALCLKQINSILFRRTSEESSIQYTKPFSRRTSNLISSILINYIKCHCTSKKNYKNVMECCSILIRSLKIGWFRRDRAREFGIQSIMSVLDIIRTIPPDLNHAKPVILELLTLLGELDEYRYVPRLGLVEEDSFMQELKTSQKLTSSPYAPKVIDLAFQFEDQDIMNEFAIFFKTNKIIHDIDGPDRAKYVDLVWKHMYLSAKETGHYELSVNSATLMMDIENDVDKETFLQARALLKETKHAREYENALDEEVDKVELWSIVDDILNYELKSDGITDCY